MRELINIVEGDGSEDDELEPVELNDFTRSEFVCGACGTLAAALHDITGWPMYVEYDHVGDVAHAWVMNPDGNAVDINGVHQGNWAKTPYSEPKSGFIEEVERFEVHDDGNEPMQGYYEWAQELIAKFPEHFGLSAS